MKYRSFLRLIAVVLCISMLAACSSDNNTSTDKDGSNSKEASGASSLDNADLGDALNSALNGEAALTNELSYTFEYLNPANDTWENAQNPDASIFKEDEMEPGLQKLVYFRVNNTSVIGFDWTLDFEDCPGDLKLGEAIDLYAKFYAEELTEYPESRLLEKDGYSALGTLDKTLSSKEILFSEYLDAGETAYFAILMEMQETAGNEYRDLELANVALDLNVAERLMRATSTDNPKNKSFAIYVEKNYSSFKDIVPGDVLDAAASVKGAGSYAQYVRVTVTVSDIAAFKAGFGDNWSAEALFANKNWGTGKDITLDSVSEVNGNAVLVFYLNTLSTPGVSVSLYDGINIPVDLTQEMVYNSSLKDGFNIDVYAEAVYTSNTAVKTAKEAFAYADSK